MLRTRTPLSKSRRTSTARLACVRPPASVHPEPGSNSPLYVCSLAHSKLLTLWFFLTFFGCYLYVNDLSSFRFISSHLFCRWASELRVQKYKLFFKWPNIFEENFKSRYSLCYSANSFLNLPPLSNLTLSLSCASPLSLPRIGTAKVQLIFKLPNVFW